MPLYFDIPTGFTGFTIDVFDGSISDSEGDVTKVLFAITFSERQTDIDFSITKGEDHWSVMCPTGEYIGLKNPKVIQTNRDSAIVLFDMDEKYPSNTLVTLCARNPAARYDITPLDHDVSFVENTITGAIGFTSNEYGGSTNDEGEVERIVFNVSFASRLNEVEFSISDDDDDWAALMPDGSYIQLKNPYVLFQNKDGATIVFQMYDPKQNSLPTVQRWAGYPSNAPGILVRRQESAKWTIDEIDETHPFIPVQNIVFPTYMPVGERLSLHTQVVVYPMNSTLRGIEWSVVNAGKTGAVVDGNGWITTSNIGDITLHAHIPNGGGIGTDFDQDVECHIIDNWITIHEHPHLDNAIIAGNITESIAVLATTEFGDITYQWYQSMNGSNDTGTPLANATDPIFQIPKQLVPGNYYYFCEIRKVNFPSIRTRVAFVRVRDELRSISIYPSTASIPPGKTQQFAVDRNPVTSDESAKTYWFSSDASVISINEDGLATGRNNGQVVITARIGEIESSVDVKGEYVPVFGIYFTPGTSIVTNRVYEMPAANSVVPANATNNHIIWEIVYSKTTATVSLANGKLEATSPGKLKLRATITNGLTPYTDYVQEFTIDVETAYIPVTAVSITSKTTNVRAGEVIPLSAIVAPDDASTKEIVWSVSNAGGTGATIVSGNLLSATSAGTVEVAATIKNGAAADKDFVYRTNITFKEPFVSVESISDLPESLQYYDGENGYKFAANVLPVTATNKKITYEISSDDESALSPRITNNTLYFDPTHMTFEDDSTSILLKITVKDGLSDGVDYVLESAIYINPPLEPTNFIEINNANWYMPSKLRAYRPIIIDQADLVPFDCTQKNKIWAIDRHDPIEGCAAIIFIPTDDNHDDLVANGVHFDEEFDWEYNGNYIYPMSKGTLDVQLLVMDGLAIGTNFEDKRVLEIDDPFIPVTGINNIPTQIYSNKVFYLSPELDTGAGMDDQTATWDDRVPTYTDVKYEITGGNDVATINSDGAITPKKTGKITVTLTVPSGRMEAYDWYSEKEDVEGQSVEQDDFIKSFQIDVINAPAKSKNNIIKLTLTNRKTVSVYHIADFQKLCAVRPANAQMTIEGVTFARKDVAEVEFRNTFTETDLTNFGRNFINLTKINKIPESAVCLRNFLMGCSKFNQAVTIPKSVSGNRCLEGFLRDCTSFNQNITIPDVTGNRCLESFLRGCTKFNRSIKLPENLEGDYIMYSFMMGCSEFNSRITFPKHISGVRCMENVLRDCVQFNQPITMPEDIEGKYNLAAFMFNCNAFESPVIIDHEEFAEGAENDVITLATFYRDSALATHGTDIYGDAAEAFETKVGNQGSATLLPLRTLNGLGEETPEIPEEEDKVDLVLANDIVTLDEYDDFIVNSEVGFQISVSNSANETEATNVVVEFQVPEGASYKEVCHNEDSNVSASEADGKVTATISSIAAGETVVFTIVLTATQTGELSGTAVITSYDDADEGYSEEPISMEASTEILEEHGTAGEDDEFEEEPEEPEPEEPDEEEDEEEEDEKDPEESEEPDDPNNPDNPDNPDQSEGQQDLEQAENEDHQD